MEKPSSLNEQYFGFAINLTFSPKPCYHFPMSYTILGQFDPMLATDHPNKYMSHDMAA